MKKLDKNANPCEICKALNLGHPSVRITGPRDGYWTKDGCSLCAWGRAESGCLSKDRAMIKLLFLNLLGNKEFLEI